METPPWWFGLVLLFFVVVFRLRQGRQEGTRRHQRVREDKLLFFLAALGGRSQRLYAK
jgi:hypothetical protein